jgi:mannose-1-phosphate guanylyltransferase
MKAMILAAGYGTRLRPVTYTLPKAMVPLCGRPLIGWAIESLLAAGIRDFVVNLHHLPEPIERYLNDRYAGEARFEFSYEPEILGTGGAVRKVRRLLEGDREFFLVNGDTVQFPPYDALRATRSAFDALAALTLRHPPQGDRFTPVYFDDGRITGFGSGTGQALMFSGTHLIASRIFDNLPDKDFSGIIDEVYQPLIDSGRETIAGVIDEALWFDIGTPQRYMSASRALLDVMVHGQLAPARGTHVAGDSLVDDTANMSGTMTRSIAGQRSTIEGEIRDSVVWDDCRIAPSVVLDSCIVAHGVEIAAPIELRNALICRDDPSIPRDSKLRVESGLVLRDI